MEHKPHPKRVIKALLIEPEGVANTGDVKSEMTIKKIEWI